MKVTKNKLRPIGLWLQRRMLWLCGIGDAYFLNKYATSLTEIHEEFADDIDGYDMHGD